MKNETSVSDDGRIMSRQIKPIPVQTAAGVRMITPENLLYVEEYHHETCFVFAKERIDSTALLTAMEPILVPFGFIRCHRNYIVSLQKITFIGKEYITLENGDSIPLSMQRRDDFLTAYNKFMRMN